MQVLLVEDNEINMEIAEFYLTERGATVTKAWNGQEALEMVRTEPTRFAVVLMDVMMPVMDGLAATRAIRALPYPAAGVPILAMTAQTTKEAARECEAAGMNDQIDKPIEPNQMAEMILHWARPEKNCQPAKQRSYLTNLHGYDKLTILDANLIPYTLCAGNFYVNRVS